MSHKEPGGYDYHTHTTFSDGDLNPYKLIDRAKNNKVAVLSITDHDSVDAYHDPSLQIYAERQGLELIPGIEISSVDENGTRIHILGLGIDPLTTQLSNWSESVKKSRKTYSERVIDRLSDNGWEIDDRTKRLLLDRPVVTKAHIADSFIQTTENANKFQKEFGVKINRGLFIESLMNEGGIAFVEKEGPISPNQAIDIIHDAGGGAFIAHPVSLIYEQGMSLEEIEETIKKYDFDGIEALYYYYHKSDNDRFIDQVDTFMEMSRRLGLVAVGGSDFHGSSTRIGGHTDVGMPDSRLVPDIQTHRDILDIIKNYR